MSDCDHCKHRIPFSVFNDGFRETWEEICCECGMTTEHERKVEPASNYTLNITDHGPYHPIKNTRVVYGAR